MLRGLYTAAAGMITQQRRHDTVTNNISNINSPGYKQGVASIRSFPEMLISLTNGTSGQAQSVPIGRLSTGVFAEEDVAMYKQGELQGTKNPFDFAIVSNIQVAGLQYDGSGKAISAEGKLVFQPQAFFTVQDLNGDRRYSRSGKFEANEAGELITAEGYKVIGQDGQPILLIDPLTNTYLANVKIQADGQFVDEVNGRPLLDANGQQKGLLISRVENPNRLIREGNGVFRMNPEDEATVTSVIQNTEVQIHQGYIERSNVDPAQAMIDVTSAMRAYETNQKMIQYYDRSLDKAVNEVGRI